MRHIDRFLNPPEPPVKSKATLEQFARENTKCACCWITAHRVWLYDSAFGRDLQIHHLTKGNNGRSDERCNLLMLCGRCHRSAELERVVEGDTKYPVLTLAMQLTLKIESDTKHWDNVRLEELYHRALPYPAPIPAVYLAEREEWK